MVDANELEDIAATIARNELRMKHRVLDAVAEGHSKSWIQRHSGVARSTINRWLDE